MAVPRAPLERRSLLVNLRCLIHIMVRKIVVSPHRERQRGSCRDGGRCDPRHRPERVDRRELILRERERVVVLATVEGPTSAIGFRQRIPGLDRIVAVDAGKNPSCRRFIGRWIDARDDAVIDGDGAGGNDQQARDA